MQYDGVPEKIHIYGSILSDIKAILFIGPDAVQFI